MKNAGIFLALGYIAAIAAMLLPFLPGSYDPLAGPLSMVVQLYSGLGLICLIPGALWLYHSVNQRGKSGARYRRIFIWANFTVCSIIALFVMIGTSLSVGIIAFACLFIGTRLALERGRISLDKPPSPWFVLGVILLPVVLLSIAISLSGPLTEWSRMKSIALSGVIIRDIEAHKTNYGRYPLSLNGIWKDYPTAVIDVEKYFYTYDESSYNLYFRQPRFLFDRFGTEEFVVYNPNDTHVMLSHASWHVTRAPGGVHQGQGWYESWETGIPHWKIFWFD